MTPAEARAIYRAPITDAEGVLAYAATLSELVYHLVYDELDAGELELVALICSPRLRAEGRGPDGLPST